MCLVSVSIMALASLSIAAVNNAAEWWDGSPTVTTDKEVYLTGETVTIKVTCYIPAQFSSTGQCFYVVKDELNKTVYDFRNHTYVAWVLTSLTPPKTFAFGWNQKDDNGKQVPTGTYAIWGYEAGYHFWSSSPIAGNSTTISIVEKYTVNLVHGWNLFSLPLVASNYTSASLGLPTGSVVARWNSTARGYDVFIVGVSPQSRAFALANFRAYFVHVASACTVPVLGLRVTSPQKFTWELPPSGTGWVLAGFPKGNTTHRVSEIQSWIDTPGVKVITVIYYNPLTGTYVTWISSLPTINNFILVPGQGYGIFLSTSSLSGDVVTGTYPP